MEGISMPFLSAFLENMYVSYAGVLTLAIHLVIVPK